MLKLTARRIEGSAHRDKDVVMRVKLGRAVAYRDGLAGQRQLDAKVKDLPCPLRAMPTLDDHPA